MDTSALSAYLPKEEEVVQDERSLKEDAFYTAASTAAPKDLEQTYDQILGDFSRFGNSPIAEQAKDNWKKVKEEEASFKASEILLNPNLTVEEKRQELSAVAEERTKEPTAKEVYLKNIAPEGAPETEITVTGGITEEDRKRYGELTNTPRGEISGAIADFLLNAKEKLDRYEVKDWVPLIGGIGVGELNIGDAARLMDEISYHGLGRMFVYRPIAPGGRDNPLNYGLDKGVVDAIFLGMDVVGVAQLGKAGAKAAIKAATKKAIVEKRIEPILRAEERVPVGETIWFDRESPVGVVSRVNREAAADLTAKAVKSPKIADAIGTTPQGIVQTNLLPKLDEGLNKIYPDIYEKLVASDRATLHYYNLGKVDPYLFDESVIKGDIDRHYAIMKEQSELTPLVASSYMEDTGRAFRGNLVFGKVDQKGFTDDLEVFEAREKLVERVARNYSEEITGKEFDKLGYKQKQGVLAKVGEKIVPFKDEATGEWFVKWNFNRYYDPVVDTFLGVGANSAKFAHWEVGSLANTSVGKWFYSPATRLPEWVTAGFARPTIRATNLEKVWGDVMRNEVLAVRPRRELAQAIYKTEELGENLDVTALQNMFPTMGGKDFKSLVAGYYNYRRLVDYQYLVVNTVYRNQKITAGFKGLTDSQGRDVGTLGRPVEKAKDTVEDGNLIPGRKSLVGSNEVPVEQVYDFTSIDIVDPATKTITKGHKGATDVSSLNVDAIDVYKLDKPIKKNGEVFEFAIGVKEGRVPEELLPKIPGYYPHINDEHYFIKAIPTSLKLNGRAIPNDAEHAHIYNQHASTVGVARTQKAGDAFAAKLQADNPEIKYYAAYERSEIDDNLRTSMDSVKYAQDVAKSRREERLTLPDGTLGRLEDPAVALDKRMNQAARLYEWKDIDFEFRKNFVKEYGHLTKGTFPKSSSEIVLDPAIADEVGEKQLKSAITLYEQYAKQQKSKDTFLDPFWRSATLNAGRFLEDVTPLGPLSEALKKMSNKREPLISTALKIATVKYIHLNPIKQYIVQPAQLYELHALALSQGNLKFSREAANLMPGLLADALTRNSDKIPEAIKRLMRDTGHVPAGYSAKEYKEILDAFYDSGIPKAIDLHAVLDGVFKNAGDELDVSKAKAILDRSTAVAKGVASIPKQVGYNTAELINQIGLWLYARSEFIRLNPNKRWNDPHNLELIAAKQWGVGNSMLTRADIFPYQEGSMRALMQFTAVSNKGMMQPLNSKFLTKAEKTRLAAIRISAFGEKGIVALPLAIEGIKEVYYHTSSDKPSDIEKDTAADKFFRLSERGLNDLFVNKVLNLMFRPEEGGPKTDLMFTKSMSLSSDTGVPMGDFFRDLYKWLKSEGKASDVMPFLPATAAIFDTGNIFWDILRAKGWEEGDNASVMKYILKTSEYASGYNNFEKGLAMLHYDSLVTKHKDSHEVATTAVEAIFKMGGIASFKEEALNVVLRDDSKRARYIKDSVTKAVASLHAIEDVYDNATDPDAPATAKEIAKQAYELSNRIKHLTAMYAGAHLEEEFEEEFWRQVDREEKKGIDGIVDRMMNRLSGPYDKSRKEMYEKLNDMKQSGDKDLARLLSVLAFEIEHPEEGKE